jgi:hypothetical protein
MEQVQFAATLNFLKQGDVTRSGALGVFMSDAGANTPRGAAWSSRTLFQAACITPDNDTALRSEFLASVEANISYYHRIYVAQPNNPQGIVAPYDDYTTAGDQKFFEAIWMQDFFTAAYGYAIDMDLALSANGKTKLREFFAWKSRSIVGRLGGTGMTEFPFFDAAQYTLAVAPSDNPDFLGGTGPWYQDWGHVYAATMAQSRDRSIGNDLRGAYFPDGTSYWGNLQPAIAYAVQHEVPGALAGYRRMVGASNWSQIVTGWNNNPVWSVKPRNA